MKFGRILFVLLAILLMVSCTQKVAKSNTLIVGMELAYPPFEMTDSLGTPTGVSVDLANVLGKSLGREVKIENMSFDGLIPALKTKKIDLIISSMTATKERAQSISFSDPYLQTGLCLLVGKNTQIKSILDCDKPDVVLAVKKGTTGHIYATNNLKRAKLLVLDKEASCVLEVVQNKAQAFIYDQMSVYSHWQKNQETTLAILEPFQKEHWAIGMRQEDLDLQKQVNEFLINFKKENGFEQLGDKYLKEQKDAFKKMGYPFYF